MSQKQQGPTMTERRADKIVDKLIRAAWLFAEQNTRREEMLQNSGLLWRVAPEAEELLRSAIADVVASNEAQLSMLEAERALTFQTYPSLRRFALAEPAACDPKAASVDELRSVLRAKILELAGQDRARPLQFIVEHVEVDETGPEFFGVRLVAATPAEIECLYKSDLAPRPETNGMAFAHVEALGDDTKAWWSGLDRVDQFLDLLMGCGCDRMLSDPARKTPDTRPIRIVGRNPAVERVPIIQGAGPRQDPTVQLMPGFGWRTAATSEPLAALSASQRDALLPATLATGEKPKSMATAIVASLETLGEVCTTGHGPSKILLASSELEMLVGARTSEMSFQGQTVAVAERATWLISEGLSADQRIALNENISRLYDKGSRVRHGERVDVDASDVVELATLTRNVAVALLDRPELADHSALDAWVKQRRFS
jgi:hypothetical protein